ncbi:unnamed protein product [Symbiodinium necroappetens]|uniref:Ubiquitin-like domain-containing protein n=1 Tax=Symbiodinium necroappetens TaxID=1628268 RepID=A0A813C053_9DINO|nr:unnamed protein product [Symbiodinium necroappetens]
MWVRVNVREKPAKVTKQERILRIWVEETTSVLELRELIERRLTEEGSATEKRSGKFSLQLIFSGQILAVDERALSEIGIKKDAMVHCLASLIVELEGQQQLTCFPKHCSVDGGRIVHILGEHFPDTDRAACRFGRVVTGASIEADGSEGVSQLRCVAPAHPAGPVTLSLSFDGGATWMEGPTFWYYDPAVCSAGYSLCVPAECGAGSLLVRDAIRRLVLH